MLMTINLSGFPADSISSIFKQESKAVRTVPLPFGEAHIFFPEVDDGVQLAFLLEVKASKIEQTEGHQLETAPLHNRYFNHRSYSADVHFAHALRLAFEELLQGDAGEAYPISIEFSSVFAADSKHLDTLFAPLGYRVRHAPVSESELSDRTQLYNLRLEGHKTPQTALLEMIAMFFALDEDKLYWSSPEESGALLALVGPVIQSHPEANAVEAILTKAANRSFNPLAKRLAPIKNLSFEQERADAKAKALEAPLRLAELREDTILWLVQECKAQKLLDIGCGNGHLLWRLLDEDAVEKVAGIDVSPLFLQEAAKQIVQWGLPPEKHGRVSLLSGSLAFKDERLKTYDTIVLQEVICHLSPHALEATLDNLFDYLRPQQLLLTLPNADFNPHFPGLEPGAFRHENHHFEWGQQELTAWGKQLAEEKGYNLNRIPVGEAHPTAGPPSYLLYFQLSHQE